MKKVLAALVAVFGFLGLTTLVLFFAMAPSVSFPTLSLRGFSFPEAGNLTADIAANLGAAPAGSAPAAEKQAAIVAVGFPAVPPATPAAGAVASETTPAPGTIVEAPRPTVSAPGGKNPQGSVPAAIPSSTTASDTQTTPPPELPVASSTITVTPAAIAPPLLSPPVPRPYNGQPPNASAALLPLPFGESDFTGDARWQTAWGKLDVAGGALELSAGANSFGGAAYLNAPGAMAWTDYSMNAALTLDAGSFFALMADYADASDYVACEYTANAASGTISMQLAQYVKGYRTPLSSPAAIPWSGSASTALSASIAANGIYGTCGLDGATVTNEGMGAGRAPMSPHGGGTIGFSVNDPRPATSAITIRSFAVAAQ